VGPAGEGAGAERGALKERDPALPKDLPPPARAQASIERKDSMIKSEKRTRPTRAQRFDMVFSLEIVNFCERLNGDGILVNIF
jgi:hypothetical protein